MNEHARGTALPCIDQKQSYLPFDHSFDTRAIKVKRAVKKVNNGCIWSVEGTTIPLRCSVLLNYQF